MLWHLLLAPLLLQGQPAAVPVTAVILIFAGIPSAAGDEARLCYCWCHCSIPLAAGILHAIVGVIAGGAAILAEFLALL